MKKLLAFFCAMAIVSTALAVTFAAPDLFAAETGYITASVGEQWSRSDGNYEDHLEIPLKLENCSFEAKALGTTQLVTNQFEKISLYTRLGENGTEYDWYTLAELSEMTNDQGLPYVVRTSQFGAVLFIAMDCYYGGTKDLLASYVKAVKIEAGMTMAVYSEDHWSWNSGDPVPQSYTESEECTAEDILLVIDHASAEDKAASPQLNDVYNLPVPEEGDDIEFSLSNWHYGLNTTLTAADVAEAEAVLNSLGGERMEIDPASLSLDYDFSQTNIESPVTATYGGAAGTTTAYVADITGSLSVQVGASTVARKDSRMDHLEINFDIDNCDWDCKAIGTTQTVTNQFDKISLYTRLGEGTEYAWYTLAELSGMQNDAGMPYVVRTAQHGTTLFIAMDCYWGGSLDLTPNHVKAVYFEKGLVFATYTTDHWSWGGGDLVPQNYGVAAQAPLMEDVLVEIDHLASEGSSVNDEYNYATLGEGDTLEVVSQPDQLVYEVGESFEPEGLVLSAVYHSFGGISLLADGSAATYEYDFSETGMQTVTGSYGGKTFTVEVEVVNTIQSIEVTALPETTVYGLAGTPDWTGLEVTVHAAEGDYTAEAELLTFSSPDMLTVGEKTVTVSYRGFETSFAITVEDQNPESNIQFYTGSPVNFSDQYGCLAVRFEFNNVEWYNNAGSKALYRVDNCNNAKDHIYMQISEHYQGDKLVVGEWYSVGELMEIRDVNGTRYIERVSQFGETLLFHLDTYMGDDPTLEFIRDDVAAIWIDAGFYFVDYYDNTWGNNDIYDYWILENAILRHDLLIEMNVLGISWIRAWAETDPMTVVSLPDKTTYGIDETLDVTGLVIHCKYADGYEEDVEVSEHNCLYDFSEPGTATVTVSYNEMRVSFEVTVIEGTEDDDDPKGCQEGCNGGLFAGSLLGLPLAALAAVQLIRKKKA